MRVDHGLIARPDVIAPLLRFDAGQADRVWRHARGRRGASCCRLLDDTVLLGVVSNRDFLATILADKAFVGGDFSTGFIAQRFPVEMIAATRQASARHQALAALLVWHDDALALQARAGFDASLRGWNSGPAAGNDADAASRRRGDRRAVAAAVRRHRGPPRRHATANAGDRAHRRA
ncbi:MAG: hypothetical protein LKM39_11575 [Chiayiivirga sp.]|nr:hypothetical protein [Chiayiivirga sp.]